MNKDKSPVKEIQGLAPELCVRLQDIINNQATNE